jgi:hypothetical protein
MKEVVMSENWVKWVAGLIVAVGVVLAVWLNSQLMQFWTFTTSDVVRMLTPPVLIALFMERGLRVGGSALKVSAG